LLRAKGFSADWSSKKHFEKASDEKSERKGARKGYWRWHGALEAAYAVYAGVVTATSGIREGSSYLDAANVAGAVKLLGQAGITSSIAAYERHKQRKIAAEVEVIPSVSEVTLVPVV
jgi:hypothetical protein